MRLPAQCLSCWSKKAIASNRAQDQAQSDYSVRRAEVALARVSVAKAEIRAPFAGVVTRRWIKQGQLLAANAPVFDMADFSELRAELRVPERDASALASGQPVSFTVDALSGSRFDARITRVAPIVDGDSGTVKVTIGIDNRDGTLRPGLFARMDIAFKHIADAVLLPKAALFGKSDAAVVFQVKDGKADSAMAHWCRFLSRTMPREPRRPAWRRPVVARAEPD